MDGSGSNFVLFPTVTCPDGEATASDPYSIYHTIVA